MKRDLLAVLSLLFLEGVSQAAVPLVDPVSENQARFGSVTGTVQLLAQGSAQWIDAHIDLPLEPGDQIQVDDESEAELSVASNALWIVQGPARLIVGHTTAQEGHLSMSEGTLMGKVGLAEDGREGVWEFETPTGVCAVRGTEFVLIHSDKAGTHLGVLKGIVAMRRAESATQSFPDVMINAHEEGILEKRMPLNKQSSFSPLIQAQSRRLPVLQRRFHALANVWSPLTAAYRMELRRKYVAAPVKRKATKRPAPVRKRRAS